MTQDRRAGRLTALGILLFPTFLLHGQQTTNTHCTVVGNTASCTSTTTDYGAQQQRNNESARQAGEAIGRALGRAAQQRSFSRSVKKYCAGHPGQDWNYRSRANGTVISSGHCPSEEDRVTEVANEFAAKHRDFKRSPGNAEAVASYIEEHNLDPRHPKSYERAYRDLKRSGQLDLYQR